MRTWGRINQVNGVGGQWVEVKTDANGFNDQVYLTTLIQTLKLNLGESPFYANYGIPAMQSVMQQIQPDYYVTLIQQQFSPQFATLLISKDSSSYGNGHAPTYDISVTSKSGASLTGPIAT